MRHALAGASALVFASSLLFALPAAAQIIQNDNVDDQINMRITTPALIAGEAYEAVFAIPTSWLAPATGRPLILEGVRVLMFNNPQTSNSCGRFSIEIHEEPSTTPNVISCFAGTFTPNTKDPGATIFDLAQVR